MSGAPAIAAAAVCSPRGRWIYTRLCSRHERDRQKLLAVIEASFGTTAPFDELVVKVFNEQVQGMDPAPKAQ